MNDQHFTKASSTGPAFFKRPLTRLGLAHLSLPQLTLGFAGLALVLTSLAGCGATRAPISRSKPWEVATRAINRPPPPPVERRVEFEESAPARVDPRLKEKVTLRSEGTDLRSLLLGLSKQTQINIVLGDEVHGTVSAYLNDVPVLDALYQILRPMGFDLAIEDGFVRVYRPGLETRVYRLHYLRELRMGTNMTTVSAMSMGGGMMGGRQGGMGGMSGGMGGMGGMSMGGGMGGMGGMSGGMGGMSGGMSGGMGMGMDSSSTMLTSMFMVNFWDELGDELESMIFQGEKPSHTQQTRRTTGGGMGAGQMMESLRHGRSVADETGRALTMNSMSGTIVITAPRQTLDAIGDYIAAVKESIQRQVVIEMRILEVALSDGFELGVDARNIPLLPSEMLPELIGEDNAPALNSRFGFGDFHGTAEVAPGARRPPLFGIGSGDPDTDWSAVITALSSLGDVNIVSAPRISALHNQKAIVKVVRDRVFYVAQVQPTIVSQTTTAIQPIQFVPVVVPEGVVVDVTPLIDDDGYVTLEVHPSFSVIFAEKQAPNGQGSQPEVERREFHSTVRVRGEETVVLGGLVSERTVRSESGIPLLKDIPFLGALFRHTEERLEKAELIVMLTPRLQNTSLTREYVNDLRSFSGQRTIEEEEEREQQKKERKSKGSKQQSSDNREARTTTESTSDQNEAVASDSQPETQASESQQASAGEAGTSDQNEPGLSEDAVAQLEDLVEADSENSEDAETEGDAVASGN